jgi:hypothetical protein
MDIAQYIIGTVVFGFCIVVTADLVHSGLKEIAKAINENTNAAKEVAKAIRGIPGWHDHP